MGVLYWHPQDYSWLKCSLEIKLSEKHLTVRRSLEIKLSKLSEKHLQDYHINPTKKKKFREMRQCLIVQGGMCSLESKL